MWRISKFFVNDRGTVTWAESHFPRSNLTQVYLFVGEKYMVSEKENLKIKIVRTIWNIL